MKTVVLDEPRIGTEKCDVIGCEAIATRIIGDGEGHPSCDYHAVGSDSVYPPFQATSIRDRLREIGFPVKERRSPFNDSPLSRKERREYARTKFADSEIAVPDSVRSVLHRNNR